MMRHASRPLVHVARATRAAAYAHPPAALSALATRSVSSRSSGRSVAPRRGGGSGTSQMMPRGQGGLPMPSLNRLFDDIGLDAFNDPFFRPFSPVAGL